MNVSGSVSLSNPSKQMHSIGVSLWTQKDPMARHPDKSFTFGIKLLRSCPIAISGYSFFWGGCYVPSSDNGRSNSFNKCTYNGEEKTNCEIVLLSRTTLLFALTLEWVRTAQPFFYRMFDLSKFVLNHKILMLIEISRTLAAPRITHHMWFKTARWKKKKPHVLLMLSHLMHFTHSAVPANPMCVLCETYGDTFPIIKINAKPTIRFEHNVTSADLCLYVIEFTLSRVKWDKGIK